MSETFEDIKRLAEEGMTACQIELGNSFLTGRDPFGDSCPVNYHDAKVWLEKAHQKGAFTATHILATVYEEGKGVPENIARAIDLYKAAAASGSYLSRLRLARIYANGIGVPVSRQIAAEWYREVLKMADGESDRSDVAEATQFLSAL